MYIINFFEVFRFLFYFYSPPGKKLGFLQGDRRSDNFILADVSK